MDDTSNRRVADRTSFSRWDRAQPGSPADHLSNTDEFRSSVQRQLRHSEEEETEEEKPRRKSKRRRVHSDTAEPEPATSEGKRLRTEESVSKKRRKRAAKSDVKLDLEVGDVSEPIRQKKHLEMMGVSVSLNAGEDEVETNPPLSSDSDSFSSDSSAEEATSREDVATQSADSDAPELTVSLENVFPRNITASLHVSTPSWVWCATRSSDEGEASKNVLKSLQPHKVVGDLRVDYDWLRENTAYMLYCYAVSLKGVEMEQSVRDTAVAFVTPNEVGSGSFRCVS